MPMDTQDLLNVVKTKRIDFPETGGYLDIEYRVKAMPYGKKRDIMDNVVTIQSSAKEARRIAKELENQSLSEVERERYQEQTTAMMQRARSLMPPVVDYLVGSEDGKQQAAIINWDLTHGGAPAPPTRETLETLLDEETISFIGWQLLSDTDVGKQKPPGLSKVLEQAS